MERRRTVESLIATVTLYRRVINVNPGVEWMIGARGRSLLAGQIIGLRVFQVA